MAAAWHAYDSCISHYVFRALDAVGLHKAGTLPSPLTRDLPLIASPTAQVTLVATYLAVVFLGVARWKALGPGAHTAHQLGIYLFEICRLSNCVIARFLQK